MESIYTPRYPGTRWVIVYGCYDKIQKYAVNELSKIIQKYLPYVIDVLPASAEISSRQHHLILIGTPQDNELIKQLVEGRDGKDPQIELPEQPQGFTLAVTDSPFGKVSSTSPQRLILLAGRDELGVLYAVQELGKLLASQIPLDSVSQAVDVISLRHKLDTLSDFHLSDFPRVKNRGIWTWGFVIHDYRRFIDNMVRLKMNTLIVWNDFPPLNFAQIAGYAHARGVKIILGFHWGWGIPGLVVTNPEHQHLIKQTVLEKYQAYYQNLDLDGIYFQTITEHNDTLIDGQSVAEAACHMVNDVSAALYQLKPDLLIYFGLHATSIRERYPDLVGLDPRVTIIWEDAGGIPYTYIPDEGAADKTNESILYSKKLATFRPGTEFALVPKGWSALRWESEFEHHGQYILGEQDHEFNRRRLAERQPYWDRVNALWFRFYPLAARFYREIYDCTTPPPSITAAGLVEDGYFEEAVQPSVALFAETIWNPFRSDVELLKEALNRYFYQP
jgi:hypothetical protein